MSCSQQATAHQAAVFPIDQLPVELLQRVLGKLPFDHRRTVMPLVCKDAAWVDFCLEASLSGGQPLVQVPSRAVMAWLSERRPMLSSFSLRLISGLSTNDAFVDHFMSQITTCTQPESMSSFSFWGSVVPDGVLQMLPSLQQLTSLTIDLPGWLPYNEAAARKVHHDLLRTLAPLTKLQDLRLLGTQLRADFPPPHFSPTALTHLVVHGASGASSGMAQLTRLRELLLHCEGLRFPAAVLELPQLRELALSWRHDRPGALVLPQQVSRLAQLTYLSLEIEPEAPPNRTLDLAAVSALQSLHELEVSGFRLAAAPADDAWPRMLGGLSLKYCGLQAFPPFISTLTGLCELDLSGNAVTAIPPCVTALTRLSELTLLLQQMPEGAASVFWLPVQLIEMHGLQVLELSGPGDEDDLDALEVAFGGACAHVEVDREGYDEEADEYAGWRDLRVTACPARWRPALRGVLDFLQRTLGRGDCGGYKVVYDYQ